MIANRSWRPHLCLRCQKVLKELRLSFFAQTTQKLHLASCYSTNGQKSSITSIAPEKPSCDQEVLETEKLCQANPFLVKHGTRTIKGNIKQIRGRKGKSTSIIMLPNPIVSIYQNQPKYATPIDATPEDATPEDANPEDATPEDATPKDATPTDIILQLTNETVSAKADEVNTNISGLRPKEEQIYSWIEFNNLVDELTNGFTTVQLEEYIEKFRDKNENRENQDYVTRSKEEFLSSITPWRPDISTIYAYFDNDPDRGYYLNSRTIKQRLAIRLLRECWKVELAALAEGVGQFEIQIRSDILKLLLQGEPSPLQNFHDDVLIVDGEGLEVFRSRNAVRITTTKTRKYRVLQEIEKLVKRIRVHKVLLDDLILVHDARYRKAIEINRLIRNIYNNSALTELRRITGVIIRRESNCQISLGTIIKESSFQENSIETALRLLLISRPFSYFNEYSLASADQSLASPLGYYHIEGLNWWCKTRPWFRWTDPIPKEPKICRQEPTAGYPSINFVHVKGKYIKSKLIDNFLNIFDSREEINSDNLWSPDLSTSTLATLGAVIHTHSDPLRETISWPGIDHDNVITEFSSHVPNITRLLSLAKFEKTRRYDEEAILRFLPNPFSRSKSRKQRRTSTSSKNLYTLPSVEFHCSINKDKWAQFSHANAIIQESRTDVMLPREIVDIRFYQRSSSHLLNKELSVITKFFEKCSLNFNPTGNIYVPSSITLPISKNLLKSKEFDCTQVLQNSGDETEKNCVKSTQDIEYLFCGFELRRKLLFNYEGWHLEYISVDAGKLGSIRGELSLRPIRNSKPVSHQEFINFGLELACRLTSLSSPDMTRFHDITKIETPTVKRYLPLHQSTSDYPRSFLYMPKRILHNPVTNENAAIKDSSINFLDSSEENGIFEAEKNYFDNDLEKDQLLKQDDSLLTETRKKM